MRCAVRGCGPADGGDGVQRAVEARLQIRGRTGVERTQNIWYMFVTLEVSKLSGWLNADASCRESKGGHTVRGEGAGLEAGATASSVQWRFGAEQAWSAPGTCSAWS